MCVQGVSFKLVRCEAAGEATENSREEHDWIPAKPIP